jgi:diguanylate cyclase (GGDEF)-like protein
MQDLTTNEYTQFKLRNRIKVNRYLNYVMWFFVITGPAIAIGLKADIFHNITYGTCISISAVVVVLSAIHLFLMKKIPTSLVTSLFALTALDVLIVYMAYSHVSIYLTWFLVPLLSLLFCDRFTYFYTVALNYVLMLATTWLIAPYRILLRADYTDARAYFINEIGGFTIETLILFASGCIILKLTVDYLTELFRQNTTITEQQRSMEEKMEILDSMAEIYDNVNLIDFVENTEMSLRDARQEKHGIDMRSQTHTLMNQRIMRQVMPDQLDAFLTFTNITTVRTRLTNKKLISGDFIDIVSGWFRAQYITVDASPDGVPNIVIYTIRNVDEEKRREEHLIRISMTDEMTRLFNRRCYDEDLITYRSDALSDDFVLFSVDVNGLKTVNDTKGHAAGDELIKGAADCLALSVGNSGRAYRTGGDEFMAVVRTTAPEKIRSRILEKATEWCGIYTDELTMAVGYAASRDHPGATIDELERIADADMYAEKEKHYRENGIARRR